MIMSENVVLYPNFLIMIPLAMVRGIPATVPIAREMPIVSLVEPRSSRNQNRYASRNPQMEPQTKNMRRNMKMWGLAISFPRF